jgi:hypothetical protein
LTNEKQGDLFPTFKPIGICKAYSAQQPRLEPRPYYKSRTIVAERLRLVRSSIGILAPHRDRGCTVAIGWTADLGCRGGKADLGCRGGKADGPYPAGGERSASDRNLQNPR